MPRAKAPSFNVYEKDVFLDILKKYRDVIEDKTNNAKLLALKEEAWGKVTEEFSIRYGVAQRTEKPLRDYWRHMKARAKTDAAALRRSETKTGGGPPEKPDLDTFTAKVCSLIPTQIQSMRNEFDSDAVFYRDMQDTTPAADGACGTTDDIIPAMRRKHEKPPLKKTPPCPQATVSRSDTVTGVNLQEMTTSQSNSLFQNKRQITSSNAKEKALRLVEKEHERKMEYLEIEHDFKMQSLKAVREQKTRCMT